MATPVSDLDLPFIDLDSPRDREALSADVDAARSQHWLTRVPMGYMVVQHEYVTKVLRERRFHQLIRLLSEIRQLDPRLQRDDRTSILAAEGDEHQRLRRLVSPAFTPKASDRFRPFMADTMNELIDAVADQGRCEAVADICEPYPIPIICALLGAPREDWRDFSVWATDVLSILDADPNEKVDRIVAAREALDAYVVDLIASRRGETRDDLLSDLIAAEEDGDRLSEVELIMMVEAVLVAGVDTTRNQLACALARFADHPDQWRAIAENPELAPNAVEEIMRDLGAIRGTGRYASEDIEIEGVLFPQGTIVFPSFVAANTDPNVFDDPHTFDVARPLPGPQLTFGSGIHHCLGAALARAELQEALPILAQRMPNLRLDGPIEWKPPTTAIWGPAKLPIAWG